MPKRPSEHLRTMEGKWVWQLLCCAQAGAAAGSQKDD